MNTSLKGTKNLKEGGLSSRIKTDMDENPENIQEYIAILGEHQKLFEKNGKFMEAQNTKKKGLQLKADLEKRFLDDMKKDHLKQRQEIDQAHQEEMKSFNHLRIGKMNEYKHEMKIREEELVKKHEDDLKAYDNDLEKSNPLKLKESTQLINLRKILDVLAKQQNYVQAHKVQTKIHALQKQQNPKFATDRARKISNFIYQFKLKQQAEMKALKQKLKLGLDEKKKMFDYEGNKLKQKYENTRSELEFNHKLQIQKFEKERKLNKDKLTLSKSYMCLK